MSHEPDASDSQVPREPHLPAVTHPSTRTGRFICSGFGINSAPRDTLLSIHGVVLTRV